MTPGISSSSSSSSSDDNCVGRRPTRQEPQDPPFPSSPPSLSIPSLTQQDLHCQVDSVLISLVVGKQRHPSLTHSHSHTTNRSTQRYSSDACTPPFTCMSLLDPSIHLSLSIHLTASSVSGRVSE
eukprot:GHVU01168215.1.p1 GENE.GHVU01168215.1~~GHVU01168215.1.p1  ORF type:complete len:144 (-),score=13.26 GHVU01168215.1:207-581(-)